MNESKPKIHDYAIVGGGVIGIFISEILTREGFSVVLIEKNEKLASETTRDFHEWIHMGSLYTLIPDNLMTLKFLLGSIDDLLEYYGCYPGMNLNPTSHGMQINNIENGWFNENFIHFKFRIGNRKYTFPWLFGIARAIFLIDRIKEHDWLRKRAGILDPFKLKIQEIFKLISILLKHKDKFYDYKTPDFTTNSRKLLNDILLSAVKNKLVVSTGNEFISYEKTGEEFIITCKRESFIAKSVVFTNGENLSKQVSSKLKVSYAPMAVIKNVLPHSNSFVELDYYPKNCINILTKDNGIALIGGISFSNIDQCEKYINEVFEKHKLYNPELELLYKYIGKKSEIVLNEKDDRNYLYHIIDIDENVWGIIPGKFSLSYSIAPEFYRRVYNKNPSRISPNATSNNVQSDLLSNTVWFDVSKNNNQKK